LNLAGKDRNRHTAVSRGKEKKAGEAAFPVFSLFLCNPAFQLSIIPSKSPENRGMKQE